MCLKERRINEPLRLVSGLELISVPARAGDGPPPGDRQAAAKLWSCCPGCDLSGFVCDPFVPHGAGHTQSSGLLAVVKYRSLDLSEQRVKS